MIKGGVVVAAGPTLGLTRRTRVSRQPPNQSPIGGNARALSSAIPPPFPPATALSPACRALIEFSKLGDGTTIEERTGPPQHTNMVSGGSDDGNSQPRNSETNQTTVPVLTYSWETTRGVSVVKFGKLLWRQNGINCVGMIWLSLHVWFTLIEFVKTEAADYNQPHAGQLLGLCHRVSERWAAGPLVTLVRVTPGRLILQIPAGQVAGAGLPHAGQVAGAPRCHHAGQVHHTAAGSVGVRDTGTQKPCCEANGVSFVTL